MPPRHKNKKLKLAAAERGEDRISTLEDALLHRVLYFLPPGEAVRTSVLSRRWRSVWKSMPALRVSGGTWSSPEEFNSFVINLLLFRDRSPLLEFELCTYFHELSDSFSHNSEDEDYVDMWIMYALMCEVQVLEVLGMSLPRPVVLANVSLISNCLTTLKLWSVLLDGCSMDFSRCVSLEDLMMDYCRIPAHKMFSKSPRHLCVSGCEFSETARTDICLPSLLTLRLDGNSGMIPFLDGMLPLETAFVRLHHACKDLDGCRKCDSLLLLEGLSNAKHLKLTARTGVTIFKHDLRNFPAFKKLKTLVINGWVVGCSFHTVIGFVKHAPSLERLTLQVYDERNCEMETEESCTHTALFHQFPHLKVEVRCREFDKIVSKFVKIMKAYGVTSFTLNFVEN